jgi:sugar phosphate isomerase/epimerase
MSSKGKEILMVSKIKNSDRLCIHTITTKPWSIEMCVKYYSTSGVKGITIWRQALEGYQSRIVKSMIEDAGLSAVSLCRGGFFPALESKARQAAIDDNLLAIDQAVELGVPLVVLVPGAHPGQPLETSRAQIEDGIQAVLPHAAANGIKLGIEPLHPMLADTRSAINTLEQANDICSRIDSPYLGVVVDVHHLWWDHKLEHEIERCGQAGRLFAYHISDWCTPTEDLLYDRGLMGEGCIPLRQIRSWVEAAGFNGFHEVEIFSNRYWKQNQHIFLQSIIKAYLQSS